MKFTISNNEAVVVTPTGVRTIGMSHPFYFEICKALQHGVDAAVLAFLDAKTAMAKPFEKAGVGDVVEVRENATDPTLDPDILVDGVKISGKIADMILRFKQKGIPFSALKNFWAKVQKNPQLVGKESMLEFLTHNDIPLLPNGNFLAYKGVTSTDDPKVFRACHDASFLYKLGEYATLPREQCTVDVHNSCGPGLHVGGFGHATGYGNTILDCEVDPTDVVSVPSSEREKLRACRVLPVRVNLDRKVHEAQYIDLNKETVIVIPGAEAGHERLEKLRCENVGADTKPAKKSGGRTKKTTWYKAVGKAGSGQFISQRKVSCPGDTWSKFKPTVLVLKPATKTSPAKAVSKAGKRVKIKGAAPIRTWYKKLPNGTVDRRRAQEKPPGYSSHKPA